MSFHVQEITKKALKSLGLGELSTDWVDRVWEDNFCESYDLPCDQLLNSEGWQSLVEALVKWRSRETDKENDNEEGAGLWTTLLDVNVTHRSLMSALYCLLERSKIEPNDRVCAVQASLVYLSLLQLPGCGAFKIFHPMIFQKALDVFYLFPDGVTVSAKAPVAVSTTGRRGRRKRPRPVEESCDGVELVEGAEEEVTQLLKQLIKDLHCYLHEHSLSEHEAIRYHLTQVLVRMCRTELPLKPALTKHTLTADDEGVMCVWAWRCLAALCQSRHGSLEKVVSEVFRQILPCILMLTSEGVATSSSPLPSHLTVPSHDALTFVCHLSSLYGEGVSSPLKNLVQHICTKTPDRSEYRSKLATVVCRLLSLFPHRQYSQLLDWLYKLSRNTKTSYRVFILDLISELIEQPLRTPGEGELEGEEEYRLGHQFLMRMVLSRCSDKAPSVCGRALTCLACAAGSESREVVEAVKRSLQSRMAVDPLVATPTTSNESVVAAMVRRRTTHDKVGVRKAAIQALEALVRMEPHTKKEDIEAIHDRCLDPALSVRKQALISLTSLTLERQDTSILHSCWLDGVLPMVLDREAGAQEKCLQVLEETLLNNITHSNKSTTPTHQFVWRLLSLIASGEHLDWRRYLSRALEHWSRANKLTERLVGDVCSHISHSDKEHVEAAWMLLAGISEFSSAVDIKFIINNWKCRDTFISTEMDSPLVQLLVIIGNQAQHLGRIAVQDIKDDLLDMLAGFTLRPAVIQAAMHTLCKISIILSAKKQNQGMLNSWCVPLLKSCEDYLSRLVGQQRDHSTQDGGQGGTIWNEQSEKEAIRYLFTLGEVVHLCPGHTSHHLGLLVQSILLASSGLAGTESTVDTSGQLSGLTGLHFSPSLRGYAYVTLGKMCLHNEELAKKCVVQMVRELETSKHQTIRNNLIIILCDLTVRYSAKVDPYIETISACLKDPSLIVRRQTLTLLACLLQEDYVKWRGSLFFRFVSSLVDPELKRFGEFCLVHLLLSKHPTMFYQHFIECVFHFNSYEKHKVYNRFKQTEREKELFCLKGTQNSSKRLTIYTFLLSHMADEHRLQLTGRLCQEVLGGLVDGAVPLDDDSVGVVKDTLAILACKEIKLSSLRRNVGEELADEGDKVGAAVATAQTKIISQIVKKNVIENLVPVVIAAKHLLEQKHSPLLRDMLCYLKELMQDYRSEISEVLACDKQLAEEIEFDLKRFEEEQKKTVKIPVAVTPHARMSTPLLSPTVKDGVAMVTATPPKLRTPSRASPWKPKTTPTLTAKLKTPFKVQLGVSLLLAAQQAAPPVSRPPHHHTPTTPRPKHPPHTLTQDVSSPAAARARASAVNGSFEASVARRQPQIPLQRAVLMSAARRNGMKRENGLLPFTTTNPDQTQLPGRLASTPQGLRESISFNVSSMVPPSPIPPNTALTSYTPSQGAAHKVNTDVTVSITKVDLSGGNPKKARHSKSVRGARGGGPVLKLRKEADILLSSPDTEPKKLDKWKVKLK